MTIGGGGPIVGRAIIIALGRDQESAAEARDAHAGRAELDAAELREVERAEYSGEVPSQPSVPRVTHLRRFIDRLIGR